MGWAAAWLVSLVVVALAGGCRSKLPRDTPDATIKAAKQVVAEGRADLLGDYIYAETPEMRRLMQDVGTLLGHLQDLGSAVQARFPEEVAKLKADAEASAKSGRTTGLLAQITQQATRGAAGRRPNPKEGDNVRSAFDDALKQLFADPYGWLRESEQRLTTESVDDDTVAVLWDGKPLLAPLGLTMKQDAKDHQWYFVLPTGAPGVSGFMPKTPEQYEIFGSVIATFDNVAVDLTEDVNKGRVSSLNDLSRVAGEKTFIPVAMTVFAYSRLTEAQKKDAKAAELIKK